MKICKGCGGVLGRDCWNEMECLMIGAREESRKEGEIVQQVQNIHELTWLVYELVSRCEQAGIDVRGLIPETKETVPKIDTDINNPDFLPF